MSSTYHPETDGATERANCTIIQMLHQCIGDKQRDWVAKLPAAEFAINLSRSESTGYAPFFLNIRRMPRLMIWNTAPKMEYPGVRVFTQRLKSALMAVHHSILGAQVKQTHTVNKHHQVSPFALDDLVYLSMKNMSFPKGLARKLIPKYMGPYRITEDFKNNSYRIEIPVSMKQQGIHDVFHVSLMRVHVANDDRLFPSCLDSQIVPVDQDSEPEWAADKITHHVGSGESAMFQVLWKSGDESWVPYAQIRDLNFLDPYLEALGIEKLANMPGGTGNPPQDPHIYAGYLQLSEDLNIADHSLSTSSNRPPLDTISITVITMSYHSSSSADQLSLPLNLRLTKDRDQYHLFFKERKDPYTLEIAQLDSYIAFDRVVRKNLKFRGPAQFTYGCFADLWNDTDHPCGFSLMDTDGFWVPERAPVHVSSA